MSEELHDPRTPITVTFELHEVTALSLLFERAPNTIDLTDDGVDYGRSCDLAMLRMGTALAKMSGDPELLLWAGAIRAQLDQEAAGA